MIRVLVVDGSALARQTLAGALARHDDVDVVATAPDPYVAREKIVRLRPDVVTLDVAMPRMDGLAFLAKLMRHYPLPVLVVTPLGAADHAVAMRALALGAVGVVAKPESPLDDAAAELAHAVRCAAEARVSRRQLPEPPGAPPAGARATAGDGAAECAASVIAIGASTGGPQAVEAVLRALPADTPGTLVVQHMPAPFIAAFARRLDDVCAMAVREAADGDRVDPGVVLVAPGGRHLVLQRAGADLVVRLSDAPSVHHQRPAVDVLFASVAREAGARAVGVLLTGMGADGARGLLAMREAGAHTIAQDEATSVVFGMPAEAARLGAACRVLPLDTVAGAIVGLARREPAPPARG